MKFKTASEIAVESSCEQIDAAVFSGELLYKSERVAALKEYLGRWQRAITEHEEVTGFKTAMVRNTASAPLLYLLKNSLIPKGSRVLDYGCGQGADLACLRRLGYEAEGYDPHWQPRLPEGKFDVVLCTYVLNVVDEESRSAIINAMSQYGDRIFIAVRRDISKEGMLGRGCWQSWVTCPEGFETIAYSANKYAIFAKTPNKELK